MKFNRLNIIMLLGLIAIAGILIIQVYLLKQAIRQEENTFETKARVALLEVAKRLYQDDKLEMPELNPVKEISEDHYVVNINKEFSANVLEFYLKSELAKFGFITDFEYAIYDCVTDAMVYGGQVSFNNSDKTTTIRSFPKQTNLVYYFAIRFTKKTSVVYSSLWLWVVFSVVMFFVLVIYSYSAFKLLQQKKYSALQRDFINNMTHEFKTPLTSILLSSNFLAKQPAVEEDDKMRKYTGIIIEQAGKLNDHVEKVLDLAKAESNLFKINNAPLDLEVVIKDVIENVRLKYPGAFIGFSSSVPGKKINADTFHFANLIYNLIDNSIKYSTSTPKVMIDLSEQTKNLILSFKDEGAGISKKDLELIFDKFYRVPGKRSNDVAGFGLGLFYVKKICDAHKWKITAASELQKGTIITVIMPEKYE
jgi:two-component system, OmpR family, phosphate regulon sensor histidine kinase PhoR